MRVVENTVNWSALWLGLVACVALAAGCLGSDTTVCSTGLICPAGSACSVDGSQCVGGEKCGNGELDPAEQCDEGPANSDTEPGACRTLCLRSRCGDGTLDPMGQDGVLDTADDEVCDDGNNFNVDGTTGEPDGCSADCRTDLACSNGFLDTGITEEECDDGNLFGFDGCSSSCNITEKVWRLHGTPAARTGHALAYDAGRGRVVLFGGLAGQDDTWEWDGNGWTDAAAIRSPGPRTGHAMAYDAARRQAVLFGGSHFSARTNSTWGWDGGQWIAHTPEESPPARQSHAMAYDAGRGRVVLFGGNGGGGSHLGDTWEWDGVNWANVTPELAADSPTARSGAAMAYDPVRGRIVLFGGNDNSLPLGGTWEWDGSRWTERTPALASDSPTAGTGAAMAYDAARGGVIVFGGLDYGFASTGDTWVWNGAAWTDVTPALPGDSPSARFGTAAAFDAARGKIVLFGGNDGADAADTQLWDGSTWTDLSALANVAPSPSFGHTLSYDTSRARVVLLALDAAFAAVTWEWDGTAWTDLTPALPSLEARVYHAMAYSLSRQRVVVFGGAGFFTPYLADTWEWDGTTWSDLTPALAENSPTPRTDSAMAYDQARERLILFGGRDATGTLGDTWEWDGTTWSDVTPALAESSPSPRIGSAMAYDQARERLLLYGGVDQGYENDTWEWDGTAWTEVTPAQTIDSPPATVTNGMLYEDALGRVVLFTFGTPHAWDGTAWIRLERPLLSPSTRSESAMTYDRARGAIVLFGGGINTPVVPLGDTWRLTYDTTGPEACHHGLDADRDGLFGCDDPDCWGYCTPECAPLSTSDWPSQCDAAPRCGDGVCNLVLESCRLCPADCGPCAPLCGDFHCDPGETSSSCPGDCPAP